MRLSAVKVNKPSGLSPNIVRTALLSVSSSVQDTSRHVPTTESAAHAALATMLIARATPAETAAIRIIASPPACHGCANRMGVHSGDRTRRAHHHIRERVATAPAD